MLEPKRERWQTCAWCYLTRTSFCMFGKRQWVAGAERSEAPDDRNRGFEDSAPAIRMRLGTRTRRDFLYGLGATLGTVAFHALARAETKPVGPLAQRPSHHPAKARACIFLFMEGGPSHIDTFDPKPKLAGLHLKEFNRQDKF